MNRPITSCLLPLWWESKCMSPVLSFSWKSSHFHVKCFAWALDLKKRQTAARISLQMSQVAHQAGTYPGFCDMKRLKPHLYGLWVPETALPSSYPGLSPGARHPGWTSCLNSAGRVTLSGGTTFLHINTLACLTETSLKVASISKMPRLRD